MKHIEIIISVSVVFFIYSCGGSKNITSSWKTGNQSRPYTKIMVVGIIKDTNIALRKEMETHFVNDLKEIGYNAVSALAEFGEGGLKGLEQEETYVRLCNKGIDAIITIALLDRKKEKFYVPVRVKYYSNLYYYNRIWNYNIIQANLTTSPPGIDSTTQYSWETILFDLQTLSPVYTIQTKSFNAASLTGMMQQYEKLIVSNMIKNKVISRTNRKTEQPLRTF